MNIVKNLKIPEYENLNPNFEKVKDPVFNAVLKHKNHPSIIAIKKNIKKLKNLLFMKLTMKKLLKKLIG